MVYSMKKICYEEIKDFIQDQYKIGAGKEVNVYPFFEKVIKIFHSERKTTLDPISEDGLIQLANLTLKCFNTPIDLVMDGDRIVGYTEVFLEEQEFDPSHIDFQAIKEDLVTLSNAGFRIVDLFYNYIDSNGRVYFTDLTCYQYVPVKVDFLRKQFLEQNLVIMNNFLIGLLLFGAFKKGEQVEYTKAYLANEYRLEHCPNSYFGDLYLDKTTFKKF